jgi:hypothetical protein
MTYPISPPEEVLFWNMYRGKCFLLSLSWKREGKRERDTGEVIIHNTNTVRLTQ